MNNWNSSLVLPAILYPDMSQDEVELAIEDMFSRSEAISKAIAGNMSASDLAELIRAQDFEIDSWIDDIDKHGSE